MYLCIYIESPRLGEFFDLLHGAHKDTRKKPTELINAIESSDGSQSWATVGTFARGKKRETIHINTTYYYYLENAAHAHTLIYMWIGTIAASVPIYYYLLCTMRREKKTIVFLGKTARTEQ